MRNPSSILRGSARRLRRPSPALIVAGVALFMSLGGASYAATTLGKNSVKTVMIHGSAVTNPKIADNAVTYNKIKPSSVGTVRIVKDQVQERVKNTCPAGQAISAVDVNGKATCVPSASAETSSAAGSAVAVSSPTTAATVSTLPLASGSAYMVQSNPYITVTPSTNNTAVDQHVVVTCTLSGGTASTAAAQRSVSFDLPSASATPAPQVQTASIPLTVVAPSSTSAANATVTCVSTVTATSGGGIGNPATNPATITAQGLIYGTQLGAATTATTTTTTTTGTTTTPAP